MAKKKVRTKKRASKQILAERPKYDLPAFYEPQKARFLARRVAGAARNKAERQVFLAILRRAYEDTLELQALYREIPGLIAGNSVSTASFLHVLHRAIGRKPRQRPFPSPSNPVPGPSLSFSHAQGGFPCWDFQHILGVSRLLPIAEAAAQLAKGNGEILHTYADALRGLWRQTQHVEELYRLADIGIVGERSDRLYEHLTLIMRSTVVGRFPVAWPGGARGIGADLTFGIGGDGAFGGGHPGGNLWPPDGFDDGNLWPPPTDGPDISWPPDGFDDGDLRPTPCELFVEACAELVLDSIYGQTQIGPTYFPRGSTNADGITGISPRSACAGQRLTIHGSGFGSTKPAGVDVLIGKEVASVVSWSDSQIVVTIPEDAHSGCVGFVQWTTEEQRQDIVNRTGDATRTFLTAQRCIGAGEAFPPVVIIPAVAPCTGFNFFEGTVPEIAHFSILADGVYTQRIQNSAEITLHWVVRNAINVEIRRISTSGPDVNALNPSGNSLTLGDFDGPQGAAAIYELAATNDCGTVRRTVSVTFGITPNLAIVGVEVIQAIQRYDHLNHASSTNNSVGLVAGKRTIVRTYIDPRISVEQPNITGTLDVETEGIFTYVGGIDPINPGETVTARATNQTDRDDLCHTLNFELPTLCSGTTNITVTVWERDHADASRNSGWKARRSVQHHFQPKGEQIVVMILVRDDNLGLAAPTAPQYGTNLQGARTRFPISENGFVLHVAPGFQTIGTNRDLTTDDGWEDLLDDIDDIADDFEDEDQIWTAVVPDNSTYAYNGIATEGSNYPRLVCKVGRPASFAHELAHTLGVYHADCGGPDPDSIDDRLPTQTEDVGIDVGQRSLIPAGTSELMSYCTPNWGTLTSCGTNYPTATYQDRWPSIALWNILYETF